MVTIQDAQNEIATLTQTLQQMTAQLATLTAIVDQLASKITPSLDYSQSDDSQYIPAI